MATKKSKQQQQMVARTSKEFVPIKAINNGIIILDNNYKVSGVKVTPRNIFILDESSQSAIISNLKVFYDTIDYEFWLVCADRPVDISMYLSQLQLLYSNTQNPEIRKLIMQDINKANQFMQNDVVDTEYYILFREKNDEIIQKRIRNLMSNLANCGLSSAQTSNEDLRVILDNFLNGGMTTEFGTVIPL